MQGEIKDSAPNKCERLAQIKMRYLSRTMADISLANDVGGCCIGKTVKCSSKVSVRCSCQNLQLTYDKPLFEL